MFRAPDRDAIRAGIILSISFTTALRIPSWRRRLLRFTLPLLTTDRSKSACRVLYHAHALGVFLPWVQWIDTSPVRGDTTSRLRTKSGSPLLL